MPQLRQPARGRGWLPAHFRGPPATCMASHPPDAGPTGCSPSARSHGLITAVIGPPSSHCWDRNCYASTPSPKATSDAAVDVCPFVLQSELQRSFAGPKECALDGTLLGMQEAHSSVLTAVATGAVPERFDLSAPGLVGDYVRFYVGGMPILTLPHTIVSAYDSEQTQNDLRRLHKLGAKARCLCAQDGNPMNFFDRDGKYQVAAVTRLGHVCERYSKGAHPKGDRWPSPPSPGEPTGALSCRADLPLTIMDVRAADPREYQPNATVGDPTYLSTLGLTRLCFDQAGWSRWSPASPRTPEQRWSDMQQASTRILVNGSPLASAVTVLSSGGVLDLEGLRHRLDVGTSASRIPLQYVLSDAVGLLKRGNTEYLDIRGLPEPLALSPSLGAWFSESQRRIWCRLRATTNLGDSAVVVLAGLIQDESGNLALHSVLPHLMSPHLVPAESRFEARAIKDATLRGLTFERSFANVPGTNIVCDLTVHFDGYRVYVEVWGMNNPVYNLQRTEKTAEYRRLKLILAEWDALKHGGVPNMRELIHAAILRSRKGS